jgi:hypothetical protein
MIIFFQKFDKTKNNLIYAKMVKYYTIYILAKARLQWRYYSLEQDPNGEGMQQFTS